MVQERGVDPADLISFLLELSFHVTGEVSTLWLSLNSLFSSLSFIVVLVLFCHITKFSFQVFAASYHFNTELVWVGSEYIF